MTNNDIIKALEWCANGGDCKECAINPHKGNYGYCTSLALKAAIDLINRQQAEIEKLQKELPENKYGNRVKVKNGLICTNTLEDYDRLIGDISAEAIKEFAEIVRNDMPNIKDFEKFPKTLMTAEINAVESMLLNRLKGERE